MSQLIPTFTMDEALDPKHPLFDIPVPWGRGRIEVWTLRGRVLQDLDVADAQHTAFEAGRKLTAPEVVKELVENGGCIPLRAYPA